MVGEVAPCHMSIKDQGVIRYYKCFKYHEKGAKKYTMIGGVALGHNIVVKIFIPI